MEPCCGTLIRLFTLFILLLHTVHGLLHVRLLRARSLRAPSALNSLGQNIGNMWNIGDMGKPQQRTAPTPESTPTPFEQAVQLKKMDMEMKKMYIDIETMKMDIETMKMGFDIERKKMDIDIKMKKMDIETNKMDKNMEMHRLALLTFFISTLIFSISIRDGLLGDRSNTFLTWLQAGLTKHKLFLSAWVGASIADKVSLLLTRVWNFAVFLKTSLPVPKLF